TRFSRDWSSDVCSSDLWGTSAVGSSGDRALTALGNLLNRELDSYQVVVQPTPGAIVSVKGFATGEFDGYYGADTAFYELANNARSEERRVGEGGTCGRV